jgi:iduronate 2-sulfatase
MHAGSESRRAALGACRRFAASPPSPQVLVAALLALGGAGCGRRAAVPRPNVLVIAAAPLSVRLGSYGDAARTPHVDRLAAQGRRFEHAYRAYPDFALARASWTTGRRPEAAADAPALAAQFAGARYAVSEASGATPADAALRAAAEIERLKDGRAQDRPFFVSVSLPAPEPGWLPPAQYLEGYSVRDVVLPPPADVRVTVPAIALADAGQPVPPAPTPPPTDHQRRRVVAERALASYLDAQVGVILAALDRAALWESTVVVLVGEQAAAADAAGLREDLLREDALRVPLVIAGPGVSRGGRATRAPVELLDVLPTLADLAGFTAVSEGRSLRPLLEAPGAGWTARAVSSARRRADPLARSVRTERWRFTQWPDGSRELFDHAADPGEHVNLAARPEHAAAMEQLRRQLAPPPPRPGPVPEPSAAPPLNVLLVTVDDLGARLGSYGAAVRTPHVDRLARLGRRFDRAYAQYSSCSPSRTSFMTGWRPERTGVWSNAQPPRAQLAGAVPLQEHFRAHGYFTARVGKVFHGPYEDQFRWDLAEHTPYAEADEDEPSERGHGMASWWRPTDNADADEPDGRAARRAAALIEQPRGRPFFIAVGFNKPHLRWVAPRRYFDLYPPSLVRWTPDPAADFADIPEIAIARRAPRFAGALLGGPLEPEDLRAQAIAAYQACTSFMDAQVGVLLAALDRARLWPRTAVVFTSDHGFHLGEHTGLWRKNTLFEESLRVPLVIVAPGLARRGEPALRVVELVDLYPTLVELARLPPPPLLDGVSLVEVLRDPAAQVKDAARSVAERVPPELGQSLRTERWRYTLWPDGSQELYDHRRDPGERRNLAGDPGQAATLQDLRARLVAAGEGTPR